MTYYEIKDLIPTSRALTALYAFLQSLKSITDRKEVIVPTLCCPSIVEVIFLSDFLPVFCDIDPITFTICTSDIKTRLTKDTAAILLIYLFGHSIDINMVHNILRGYHRIYLIEDVAQSLGGKVNKLLMGTSGDATIFSFTQGKILDIGNVGGLYVKDERLKDRCIKILESMPSKVNNNTYKLLSLSHRNLYHAGIDLLKANDITEPINIMKTYQYLYKNLYLYKCEVSNKQYYCKLQDGLSRLETMNQNRHDKANILRKVVEVYPELFKHFSINLDTGVIWRFSFLCVSSKIAVEFTSYMRSMRLHVSNHYWPSHTLFGSYEQLKVSRDVSSKIVNLWVDNSVDYAYIHDYNLAIDNFAAMNRKEAVYAN